MSDQCKLSGGPSQCSVSSEYYDAAETLTSDEEEHPEQTSKDSSNVDTETTHKEEERELTERTTS